MALSGNPLIDVCMKRLRVTRLGKVQCLCHKCSPFYEHRSLALAAVHCLPVCEAQATFKICK